MNLQMNFSNPNITTQMKTFFKDLYNQAIANVKEQWYYFTDMRQLSKEEARMNREIKKAQRMANAKRRRYYVFMMKGRPVAVNKSEIELLAKFKQIRQMNFHERLRLAVFIADCDNTVVKEYDRRVK